MKQYHFLLFVLFALFLSSCSSFKEISYFQDLKEPNPDLLKQIETIDNVFNLRISSGDELSIIVSDGTDPVAAVPFNLPIVASQAAGIERTAATVPPSIQSYLVASDGTIQFPVLGKVNLAGMTDEEATDFLIEKLNSYLKNPIVSVRILNFQVSVLGEVNSPGVHLFDRKKVTILDAVAAAKDLTVYGRRDNVLLIREEGEKRELVRFDLTKSDLFLSPYYYLKPNDLIVIEPNELRQKDSTFGQQKQYNLTVTTSVISYLISTVSLIVAIIVR